MLLDRGKARSGFPSREIRRLDRDTFPRLAPISRGRHIPHRLVGRFNPRPCANTIMALASTISLCWDGVWAARRASLPGATLLLRPQHPHRIGRVGTEGIWRSNPIFSRPAHEPWVSLVIEEFHCRISNAPKSAQGVYGRMHVGGCVTPETHVALPRLVYIPERGFHSAHRSSCCGRNLRRHKGRCLRPSCTQRIGRPGQDAISRAPTTLRCLTGIRAPRCDGADVCAAHPR